MAEFRFGLALATSQQVGITAVHLEVLELSDWEFQVFISPMDRAVLLLVKQPRSRFHGARSNF
jgi:hypothetical protein